MVWLLVIGFVLALFVLSQLGKSKDVELEAGAAYETIKRSAPDSPLAQMGESEFKLSYKKSRKARRSAVRGLAFVAFFLCFAIAVNVFEESRDGEHIVYALALSIVSCIAVGLIGNSKLPKVSTIMKNQLKESSRQVDF